MVDELWTNQLGTKEYHRSKYAQSVAEEGFVRLSSVAGASH